MKYQKRHWLASLRVGLGLTQEQLSAELGIPQSTYAAYESGRRTPRNFADAKAIGRRLGFDPMKLLEKSAS